MNKKAILVVSFGSTYKDTREKTICAIEYDIEEKFSDYVFYRAWTSGFIRKKLEREEGLVIDSVESALDKISGDGIRELVIQPTHMIKGHEYEKIAAVVEGYRDRFDYIRLGQPLLEAEYRRRHAVDLLYGQLKPEEDQVLILMGHGTDHGADATYETINTYLRESKRSDIFMATVEGKNDVEKMMAFVEESGCEKVILAPFMIVAGDHAINDMAGDHEGSWKNRLIQKGYKVTCHIKGLGEYKEIRDMFIEMIERGV